MAEYRGKKMVVNRDNHVLYDGADIGIVYPDGADQRVQHDWSYAHTSGVTLRDLHPDRDWARNVQAATSKQEAAHRLADLQLRIAQRAQGAPDPAESLVRELGGTGAALKAIELTERNRTDINLGLAGAEAQLRAFAGQSGAGDLRWPAGDARWLTEAIVYLTRAKTAGDALDEAITAASNEIGKLLSGIAAGDAENEPDRSLGEAASAAAETREG